ncbi:hypothetical protein EYZ11_002591 [Aspergillus tanneri]|uniref:Uncharacterized protein n=1 Tax=Aspergillus tanneri TaxID=1220188 RepID=A0A4V3UQ75_9EURO|nr:hypothetical protein EYZ11_002591 [Aspergillus tanneri]
MHDGIQLTLILERCRLVFVAKGAEGFNLVRSIGRNLLQTATDALAWTTARFDLQYQFAAATGQ